MRAELEYYRDMLPTPVKYLPTYGCYLKCEFLLPSGSHKDRETVYLIKSGKEKGQDCVIATSGNAGISLAYYLKKKAHVVVPETCSSKKQEIIRGYDADLIIWGKSYAEAWIEAEKLAKWKRWRNVSAGVESLRYVGHMGIPRELSGEGNFDVIIVPGGNHTLAYGIAEGAKIYMPHTQIVSVVLPNHPFFMKDSRGIELTPSQIAGYESIAVGKEGVEWRFTENKMVDCATCSVESLDRVRKRHENTALDLVVCLALEVSKLLSGRKKVVIGTGLRR